MAARHPVDGQRGTIGGRSRKRLSGRAAYSLARSARVAGGAIPGMPDAAWAGALMGPVAATELRGAAGGAVAAQAGGADK